VLLPSTLLLHALRQPAVAATAVVVGSSVEIAAAPVTALRLVIGAVIIAGAAPRVSSGGSSSVVSGSPAAPNTITASFTTPCITPSPFAAPPVRLSSIVPVPVIAMAGLRPSVSRVRRFGLTVSTVTTAPGPPLRNFAISNRTSCGLRLARGTVRIHRPTLLLRLLWLRLLVLRLLQLGHPLPEQIGS
jgi:hypothetical protein